MTSGVTLVGDELYLEIERRLDGLIQGDADREEIAAWAYEVNEADDELAPPIREVISSLELVNLPTDSGAHLYQEGDFRQWRAELLAALGGSNHSNTAPDLPEQFDDGQS